MKSFEPLHINSALPEILNRLFSMIESPIAKSELCNDYTFGNAAIQPQLLRALLMSYMQILQPEGNSSSSIIEGIVVFNGYNDIQPSQVKEVELALRSQSGYNSHLNTAITYLLDELVCNIQQHSYSTKCLVSAIMNRENGSIDMCVSDNGISLYGSYVKSGRYRDMLGDDSISALCMAKDGFSTKNRPDAENRGYGISSNLKMVINGLSGDFSIISGNALYLNLAKKQQLIGLPETIEWQGTTIVVRIPINPPKGFNLYDYIA